MKANAATIAKWLLILFVLQVGVVILTPYRAYFALDFDRGFLRGRESYFFSSGYFLGFYGHIVGAPVALLCGALNLSVVLRLKWPRAHRWGGRVYVAAVLSLAMPGALVMSLRAYGGLSSTLCFASLALTTWLLTMFGWRAARRGEVSLHGRLMARSYVLMTSAVWLRVLDYWGQNAGLSPERLYQLAAWTSWLLPILIFELLMRKSVRKKPT